MKKNVDLHSALLGAIINMKKCDVGCLGQLSKEAKEALNATLSTLSPREEHVMRVLYSPDGDEYALACSLQVSRERIRQLKVLALSKLRNVTRRGPLAVRLQELGMNFQGLAEALDEHRTLELWQRSPQSKHPADDWSIDRLELSMRTRTVLLTNGITTVGQLRQKTFGELAQLPNFGRKSLWEVTKALAAFGWRLG